MNTGKSLFSQVMEFVPWTSFARIVQRYAGSSRVRTLSCAEQLRATAFAQLTWRESLRDIEVRLSANATKLYANASFRVELERTAYALDSSTIDLCLSLFGLAPFRSTKAAIAASPAGHAGLRGRLPST